MSVHHLFAASELLAQPDSSGLTAGRLWSLVGVTAGSAGVVLGLRAALRRAGRRSALIALLAGLAGALLGVLVVAAAEGGPGTGSGIVGGFLALTVGLVAAALGAAALKTRHGRVHPAAGPSTEFSGPGRCATKPSGSGMGG